MKRKSLRQDVLNYWSNTQYPASVAELRIIGILIKHSIPYLREVCFKGFTTPNGGYYRYDFLLLRNRVLIEYDGKEFHSSKEQKRIDRLKNKFAKDNNISLIRLNKSSWSKLDSVLLQASLL